MYHGKSLSSLGPQTKKNVVLWCPANPTATFDYYLFTDEEVYRYCVAYNFCIFGPNSRWSSSFHSDWNGRNGVCRGFATVLREMGMHGTLSYERVPIQLGEWLHSDTASRDVWMVSSPDYSRDEKKGVFKEVLICCALRLERVLMLWYSWM